MTDGERKSQHQQQWEQVYEFGFEQGHRAALNEANVAWVAAAGRRVFTSGLWADTPTAAERKAERLATIREAHEAGVHAPIAPAQGCPWCDYGAVAQHLANCADRNHDLSRGCDIAPLIHHNGDYGVRPGEVLWCLDEEEKAVPSCTGDHRVKWLPGGLKPDAVHVPHRHLEGPDTAAPTKPVTMAVNEAHAAAIRKAYPDANVHIMARPVRACSELPGCRPGPDAEHSPSCGMWEDGV